MVCENESGEGQQCAEPIDLLGDHATQCKIGPHVNHKHDAACDQLCNFVEEVGASARREVIVLERCDSILQRLDVRGYGAADVGDLILDVTVRHPMAARYQPSASVLDGHAAGKPEEEEIATYPPTAGT